MDTFAQQFITPWVSGGARIKVQMDNSVKVKYYNYNDSIETGDIDLGYDCYFYDWSKSWVSGEWVGYVILFPDMYPSYTDEYFDILQCWGNYIGFLPVTPFSVYGRYGIIDSNNFTLVETGTSGITPNLLKIELFLWDNDYSTTIGNTALVTDYATVASEEIEDGECWIYLFWKALAAGIYLWKITPISGDNTGSFRVLYDPDSSKSTSWKNTLPLTGDYYSEVMGLDNETYENVMSVGDSFDSGFIANSGVSNIKVNKSSVYYNAIKSGNVATTVGGLKGRVATGSLVKVD